MSIMYKINTMMHRLIREQREKRRQQLSLVWHAAAGRTHDTEPHAYYGLGMTACLASHSLSIRE